MSVPIPEKWLSSKQFANICGLRLQPLENPHLRHAPLAVRRGQATAYCLVADDGEYWILKRFHRSRVPDRQYLEAIASLLPKHEAFESGTKRRILSIKDLATTAGCYANEAFAEWLEDCVLMPVAKGVDWSSVADDQREGKAEMDSHQRLALCKSLSGIVDMLERKGLSPTSAVSHHEVS